MKLGFVSRALVAAAATLACSVAFSAPPSEAQVRQLLEVSRTKEMMEGVIRQQTATMPQQMVQHVLADKNPSPEEQAKFVAVLERGLASLEKSLSWEKMEPVFIKMHTEVFDADDVQAMLSFYQSPSGQKMLEKMPLLMQKMGETMQTMMIPAIEAMEKEIEAALKE